MKIKELKPKDKVFVYNKNSIDYYAAEVIEKSNPQFRYLGNQNVMVVDLKLKCGDVERIFTIEEEASMSNSTDYILAISEKDMVSAIEGERADMQRKLDAADIIRCNVVKVDNLLKEISPEHRERNIITEKVESLERKIEALTKLLEENGNKNAEDK